MEPRRSHPRARSGFGILALIVMVGIVAALMVASLPMLIQRDRLDRVDRTATILTALDTLINNSTAAFPDFQTRVGRNPGRLSHLTIPITNTDLNACGNTYNNGQVTNWQQFGPFGTYYIDPAIGLKTPIGIANDVLVRNPVGGGANSTIAIVFPTADYPDVQALDQLMDPLPADSGRVNGLVRWTLPAADGSTVMSYVSPIDNGC